MLTASIIVLFAVAFMVGSLLDLIDNNTWLANADHSVAKWGSRNGTSDTAKVLTWITQLGSTVVVIPVLIAVSIFGYKRQRHRDVFVFVAVVGLGQLLLSNVLKIVVHRDRPAVLHLVSAHGYSFPSGHTVAAASVWSAVALLVGTGASRRRRAVLAGAASLIALSVATSRALLGVHWISDVIAGLAIGWGWFMMTAIVFGGRSQRLGDPATPPPGGHTPSVSEDESRIQASSIGP